MALIGYARISTEGQDLAPQRAALTAVGCKQIVEETASGADRGRPELARLLGRLRRGDVLVVMRLDGVHPAALRFHTVRSRVSG
jgi:DNA invertase Pin-like site-specific DNA recombinase